MDKLKKINETDQNQEIASGNEIKEDISKNLTLIKHEHFSGPLPPPEQLKEYNEILPGAAGRIFSMAEKALDSSIEVGKKMVEIEGKKTFDGQRNALTISLTSIIAAVLCAYLNQSAVAIAIIGGFCATVIPYFFYSKPKKKEDKEEKKIQKTGK